MAKQKIRGAQMSSVVTRQLDVSTLSANRESIMIKGWGFITVSGTPTSASVIVTFGVTFASPPTVIATTLGYKNGSDPTSINDNQGVAGEIVRGGQLTSTTQTTIFMQGVSGGALGSGLRLMYNIVVIGELA